MQLQVAVEHSVLLQHASTLFLHRCSVDAVFVAHMRVLRAPLLECLGAADDRACEGLLTRVDSHVVLESTHRLAATPTVFALMRAFTRPVLLGHSRLMAHVRVTSHTWVTHGRSVSSNHFLTFLRLLTSLILI